MTSPFRSRLLPRVRTSRQPRPTARLLALASVTLATVAALTLAVPLAAQELTADDPTSAAARPTPRGADGKPDFSGYWKGTKATKPVGNIGKDLPGFKLQLTPAGEAALTHNLTATIDPESLCIIGGIPRHNASGLPFEILQGSRKVAFLYWYSYFRLIPIGDDLKHAEDPDPAFFGEPIAKWDGDTLVIDTIAVKGEKIWIDENANPVSEEVHVVERWTRPDFDHLSVHTWIHDPKFYTRPFTYTRTWVIGKPDDQVKEYSCSENNVSGPHLGFGPGPIRADGSRGYDNPAPLPPPVPRATNGATSGASAPRKP